MNDHYPKPEVGMDVFVVKRHRTPYSRKITKIGRIWATLENSNDRFDITTWRLDGGKYSSPGVCYPSEHEYISQQALNNAWWELRKKLQYQSMSHDVTLEKVRQAAALLGIELL